MKKLFMLFLRKVIFPVIIISLTTGCATKPKQYPLSLELIEELETVGETQRNEQGVVIRIKETILFDFNKADLKPESEKVLTRLTNILKKYRDTKIAIEGYTDNMGPDYANEALSKMRAESVQKFLMNHDVNANRITAKGLGQRNPVVDNGTREGRAKNRRVEIHIFPNDRL